MRAIVCVVKLCLPVSHFDISDSLLLSKCARSFCVRFFSIKISLNLSAMPNDKSNSAFCSGGTAVRQSRNNLFRIIVVSYFKDGTFNARYHIFLNGDNTFFLGFKKSLVKSLQVHDIAAEQFIFLIGAC